MQPLLIFLPKPQAVPPLRTPQEPLGGRLGFAPLRAPKAPEEGPEAHPRHLRPEHRSSTRSKERF